MNNILPQGYKQTELGIIPEDWEVVNLSNLAKVNGRIGFRGYTVADLVDAGQGAYAIGGKHIANMSLNLSDAEYISWEKYYESPEIMVKKGDIVLAQRGTLGKSAIIANDIGPATINPSLVLINKIKCDNGYLAYWLQSEKIIGYICSINSQTSIPMITQNQIEHIPIAIPYEQNEQRAIAEALNDVDGLIAALDKKIAKKRLLKQGAMQQLLTGKKRLPGFSDEWVEKKLGDIGVLFNGYAFKSETYNKAGKYNIITIANVQNGKLTINDCNRILSIPSDIQEHQKLKKNDILISMTGNVGRACLVNASDCLLNQRVGLFVIRDTQNCDKHFIFTIINDGKFENAMIESGQGAAQANIGKKDIEGFTFLLPTNIKEQQAIATILSDMDKEIADLEAQRDKYRLLKSGMMQKLLTGQIRLK